MSDPTTTLWQDIEIREREREISVYKCTSKTSNARALRWYVTWSLFFYELI